MRKLMWLILVTPLCLSMGCTNANPVPTPTGILYVLDDFDQSVYVFPDIDNLNGALDPVRTITGGNTLITDPKSLAVDSRRDILYVADSDQDAVLAFIPASTTNGDIAPRRIYPGVFEPGGMYYDLVGDVLYVVDLSGRGFVQIWDRISQLPDNSEPTRSVTLDYDASAIFVNTEVEQLYLGEPDFDLINVYLNALRLDTIDPPPVDRTIFEATPSPSPSPTASQLGFDAIDSITMNAKNDILYVAESENPSIEIFDHASDINSTANGPAEPDRALIGDACGFTVDMGQIVFMDNVLYAILSRTNIGVWDSANTVDGNIAPNRNILVNGATEIVGITVDLSH